jgi:ADP-heptose:LPS heptosyltransferase
MNATDPIAVKGGIGDFLQCLPYMLSSPKHRYLVASHYARVLEFFAAVGLTVEELSLGRLTGINNCPRQTFFLDNPFQEQEPLFTNGHPVLGIHLGGSSYSLSVEKRFGFPPKALPVTVFEALMSANADHNIILFGAAAELDTLIPAWRESESKRLKFVADDDVTVSLSRVAECSTFIGSDSAFKTMSAMLHIQTIVWIGDYKDDFRDSVFIDPYVKAGIMAVVRYRDLSSEHEVHAGVKLCQKEIELYD